MQLTFLMPTDVEAAIEQESLSGNMYIVENSGAGLVEDYTPTIEGELDPYGTPTDYNIINWFPLSISNAEISSGLRLIRVFGPAVDNHVIFPELLGSPGGTHPTWYWACTVDTSKTGTHDYSIEFEIMKSGPGGKQTPLRLTTDLSLEVRQNRQSFAFSAPPYNGYLPLY